MRVAIVTCGLLDCMLPLVRHLSKHVSIDLYISVYGNKFAESVGAFDLSNLPFGMADEAETEVVMGRELLEYTRQDGRDVKVKLFRYPNLKVLNKLNWKLHHQFARAINHQNYDLVHFNGYRGSQMFIYAMLKRKYGKVWTVHDPILHSGEDKWQTRLAYSSYKYLKAHYIVHNRAQQPVFVAKYGIKPQKCHFVTFGPLEVFKVFKNGEQVQREPKTVLFYGRISPYKGVEYLIEAAHIAREKVPELKVVIAGKPSYAIDLKGIKEDPSFEVIDGYVPNKQLVKLIEQSALVVCPYTDATQSGVVMTAYAFNKPVLATAVGGIPEVVEDGVTGRLVPPKDSQALANAMVDMLMENNVLDIMSDNLARLNQSGSLAWENIAQETLAVYQESLKA